MCPVMVGRDQLELVMEHNGLMHHINTVAHMQLLYVQVRERERESDS